ncbi:hypothetical protein KC959_03605 [Candidatus Saccharibacteria bacterium]|nr:hypothetical protein [Candidatus Saccharibacteria bacterium]
MKRFLSHVLMNLAVFLLTASLFIWTIDARVLDSDVLNDEFNKAGVSQELTKLLPEMLTSGQNDATQEEIQDIQNKVSDAIQDDYVQGKIEDITASVIGFMKGDVQQPVIDLSDFPEQLRARGVDVDDEFAKNFEEPIEINKDGNLNPISDGYSIFSTLKYIGLGLFALVLILEWFVTEKGKKLKRVSRIFLYSGLWFLLYWGLIILLPKVFGDSIRSSVQANYDASGLIDAIIKAVQGLFASYFLGFAVGCFVITAVLYAVRHFVHGDVVPNTNPAPQKAPTPDAAAQSNAPKQGNLPAIDGDKKNTGESEPESK